MLKYCPIFQCNHRVDKGGLSVFSPWRENRRSRKSGVLHPLLLRQPIQLVHQPVDLLVRDVNAALDYILILSG